eukprot:1152216-Pelagomonas_calceolata.AAC.2
MLTGLISTLGGGGAVTAHMKKRNHVQGTMHANAVQAHVDSSCKSTQKQLKRRNSGSAQGCIDLTIFIIIIIIIKCSSSTCGLFMHKRTEATRMT